MIPFEYAVLRVVPRIERAEFVNAGVIVYSQKADYLGAAVHLDADRLRALDPDADVDAIRAAAEAYAATCTDAAAAGPVGATPIGERFRWLTAPRSTIVQTGPVHAGLTDDPAAELDRLLRRLVL
ncbi:DUF3037 domain-containing protein [Jiangella anatolica]|uniref:DUF3037 domain-containing protein n=1 Tax=Jiangella anatolica TaxID=2670374 RepID=A0A2W2B9M9_9ACTN|nr:DUF3037 domain-containing protein [Jiangella anatolica]PZF81860.1 DUF3037 domain-containing protein [Jiangella anatolica]